MAVTPPLLQEFGPSIWTVEGPEVNFCGCPYPTRMVIVKLNDTGTWVWSPVALTEALKKELIQAKLDNVQYIVSPNMIHHIFLHEWQANFPQAKFYAPPGLKGRKVVRDVTFEALELDDTPAATKNGEDSATFLYSHEIYQVVVHGSFAMEEVVFYHVKSKTALVADLIQRQTARGGIMGRLLKVDDLIGPEGSTPREWRFSFLVGKEQAKRARDVIVDRWKPEHLIIAHGMCVHDGTATAVISKALSWLDKFHGLW